jgi:hypothetical protein
MRLSSVAALRNYCGRRGDSAPSNASPQLAWKRTGKLTFFAANFAPTAILAPPNRVRRSPPGRWRIRYFSQYAGDHAFTPSYALSVHFRCIRYRSSARPIEWRVSRPCQGACATRGERRGNPGSRRRVSELPRLSGRITECLVLRSIDDGLSPVNRCKRPETSRENATD